MRDFKSNPRHFRPSGWVRVRIFLLGCLLLALLGAGLLRAADLQIFERHRLQELARDQYVRQIEIPARRGDVFDRRHLPLAQSVEVDSIWVDPTLLADVRHASRALAQRLQLDWEELYHRLSQARRFAWVKRRAKGEEVAAVRSLQLPGVGITKEPQRFYPHRELAAQVLGMVGMDGAGLEGLELAFNEELSGHRSVLPGFRDAKGRSVLVQVPGELVEQRGASLYLTLDSYVQHTAESVLARAVQDSKAVAGMAVVLDPRTGALLALANYPTFNPNALSSGWDGAFRNRAALDNFEPGSTVKAFVVAAALEEGVIRPEDLFFCENGAWDVGRHTVHDTHPHAWLAADKILQFSSNIGAAKIAQVLGRDRLMSYFSRFGFGESTGLGLPGEARGALPYPKAELSLVTMAFGQGLTSTAVQLAAGFGAIANDGILMRPFLVSKLVGQDGLVLLENRPTEVRRVVSRSTARRVISMLEGVVEKEGTAPRAKMAEFRVAGKTGTAQKADPVARGYSDKRIASFVGIVPAQNPRTVVLIVIDEPKTDVYGGLVAAPAFKEIATALMPYLGVPATHSPSLKASAAPIIPVKEKNASPAWAGETEPFSDAAVTEQVLKGSVRIPDLQGAPARQAIAKLLAAALEPHVSGKGRVVAQVPPAGSLVPQGARVRLELAMRP